MDLRLAKVDSMRNEYIEKQDSLQQTPTSPSARHRPSVVASAAERARRHLNAKLANPLAGYTYPELRRMGRAYAHEHGLGTEPDDVRALEVGAMLAADPENIDGVRDTMRAMDDVRDLDDAEYDILCRELRDRWSQPRLLYLVIVLCSTCAAVQGMDETVVNGAQLFYLGPFGIDGTSQRSTWLTGLVTGAPYLCCAFLSCWLTTPFNNWFGRRGTIFLTCLISAVACFWQGFVNSWWHMFIARFTLGLGIGPKSATVPIYAAECAPPAIRGALVMQWQMWTAFGIMLGYAADLAFYSVPDTASVTGLNWRLMMGSAMFPAVIVCCFVFWCPESPRWYMSKGRHAAAYRAICSLRHCRIQAARDVFYMAELLRAEDNMRIGQSRLKELYSVPRNRRALVASEIVMFMQQFCGVNVIAYYSSTIFVESGFSEQSALGASLGFGVINFLFAIPAVYTIDTFGRRNLLLVTFPLMSLSLLFAGFSFYIPLATHPKAHVACVSLGLYLFGIVYSPGEGPVPFTYSAEAYPLYVRTLGMSVATATTWFFNFVLSITWPSMLAAFKPQGAFGWYAGWNLVGFLAILLAVPETKGKTLEELDRVFSVPTTVHAAFAIRQVGWAFRRYVLRRKVEPETLFESGAGEAEPVWGDMAVV